LRPACENRAAVKREKRERGASVLEYTILVALVVLVVVGAMTALGRQINDKLPEGAPPSTTAASSSTTMCATTTTAPGSTTTAPGSTTTVPSC
jgi:Flp pilus assembly pilin Flp